MPTNTISRSPRKRPPPPDPTALAQLQATYAALPRNGRGYVLWEQGSILACARLFVQAFGRLPRSREMNVSGYYVPTQTVVKHHFVSLSAFYAALEGEG